MRCCLKSVLSGIVLGILLIALLVLGVYVFAYPRLDSVLGDSVRRQYMLPPSATIKFEHGTFLDSWQGKLKSFVVEADEAMLEGLLINDVKLYATGIQFDMTRTLITGEAELKKVKHARLKFRVSEESLADHWSETLAARGISDVDVDLKEKEIAVSGKVDLKLTTVPVAARGVFEADGSKKIRMKVNEVSFGGNKIGPGGIADLVKKFTFGKAKLDLGKIEDAFSKSIRTPVIDLGELQMGVNVKRLEPRSGYLYIEAESEDPDELADAMRKERKADKEEENSSAVSGKLDGDKVGDAVKNSAKKIDKLGDKIKKIF